MLGLRQQDFLAIKKCFAQADWGSAWHARKLCALVNLEKNWRSVVEDLR